MTPASSVALCCSVDVTTESVASEYIDICLNRHSLAQQLFCRMPGLANGGLLLCGAKGSGKSALGGAICHRVTCHPNYAFAEVVDCKKLKGNGLIPLINVMKFLFFSH